MARITLKNNPPVNYLRNSREELRKVTWPSRARVTRDTLIVIGLSLAVGAFFGAIDHIFNIGLQEMLQIK